jgi:hypothetical protein
MCWPNRAVLKSGLVIWALLVAFAEEEPGLFAPFLIAG